MPTDFNIEVPAKGVQPEIVDFAMMIENDPYASRNERQLAVLVKILARTINNLVSDLNYGTAVVTVHERTSDKNRNDF